jgi:hypothetical protein
VQQHDLRGVTLLDPLRDLDVRLVGLVPERGGQGSPFAGLPAERLVRRHGVYDHEFGVVPAAERKRILECRTGRLREVDCYENAGRVIHGAS